MYGDDYRDHSLVEDGWAVHVNGRQKKVLELAGRVRNVALSVRNRSRADGKSRGRSIDQPIVIAIARTPIWRCAYRAYSACLSDVP